MREDDQRCGPLGDRQVAFEDDGTCVQWGRTLIGIFFGPSVHSILLSVPGGVRGNVQAV
jgi:hypothetical protein